ncbi:glutathione S-transferase family protein [Ferrimonas marina]|uniref:Glutathione S-transferase n=1 Tax=Ferrimonas marina TaxID=299255 RepID=A0A1M5Z3A8_9GAMM|nr:hypothetical protein [Ferrimonas marina]SHI18669.1 hypothetical protein SAMN02745129_4557 [Ferrimonas marina]
MLPLVLYGKESQLSYCILSRVCELTGVAYLEQAYMEQTEIGQGHSPLGELPILRYQGTPVSSPVAALILLDTLTESLPLLPEEPGLRAQSIQWVEALFAIYGAGPAAGDAVTLEHAIQTSLQRSSYLIGKGYSLADLCLRQCLLKAGLSPHWSGETRNLLKYWQKRVESEEQSLRRRLQDVSPQPDLFLP